MELKVRAKWYKNKNWILKPGHSLLTKDNNIPLFFELDKIKYNAGQNSKSSNCEYC